MTLTDHAIAAAFTDVAREFLTEYDDTLGFRSLIHAVEDRAAEYAERPAAKPDCGDHYIEGYKQGAAALDTARQAVIEAATVVESEHREGYWSVPSFDALSAALRALAAVGKGEG